MFLTVIRNYLPFFDIDERRKKWSNVNLNILSMKTFLMSFILNISTSIVYENTPLKIFHMLSTI